MLSAWNLFLPTRFTCQTCEQQRESQLLSSTSSSAVSIWQSPRQELNDKTQKVAFETQRISIPPPIQDRAIITMPAQHPLPAGLSPDSIDVVSELATILARVHYASSADTADPANKIAIRDLPTATDPLKHKLQNARAALHTLPDITRTIPEQEAEIKLVQARIERQRAALEQLKEFGLKYATETAAKGDGDADVEMSGTSVTGAEGAHGRSSLG